MFHLQLVSFGFKYQRSIRSADKIFNLRKLPNPSHSQRKKKTGLDKSLRQEFMSLPQVKTEYELIKQQIQDLLQKEIENQSISDDQSKSDNQSDDASQSDETIKPIQLAFGCHSGRHRSVAMVEYLARDLVFLRTLPIISVEKIHRDLRNK